MSVPAIPAGHRALTPYLVVDGAGAAIDFYVDVFDATELMRLVAPDGLVAHAEVQISDSRVMLSDEHPEMGFRSPASLGGSPVSLLLYTEDVDSVYARALAAGAKALRPVEDQFYGDRAGTVEDPFGHAWTIATHKVEMTAAEIEQRAKELFGG